MGGVCAGIALWWWPSARLFALVRLRSQNGKMESLDITNGDLRQARRRRTNGIYYDVNRERTTVYLGLLRTRWERAIIKTGNSKKVLAEMLRCTQFDRTKGKSHAGESPKKKKLPRRPQQVSLDVGYLRLPKTAAKFVGADVLHIHQYIAFVSLPLPLHA